MQVTFGLFYEFRTLSKSDAIADIRKEDLEEEKCPEMSKLTQSWSLVDGFVASSSQYRCRMARIGSYDLFFIGLQLNLSWRLGLKT